MPQASTNRPTNGESKPSLPSSPSRGQMLAQMRPDLCAKLSEAQMRVLVLLLEGHTEPQIAGIIKRSRHTIHDHTKAIYQALGVGSRVQLVLLFTTTK